MVSVAGSVPPSLRTLWTSISPGFHRLMLLLNPALIVDGGSNQKFKVAAVQQFVEALVNFDTKMASNRHSLRATVAQWS